MDPPGKAVRHLGIDLVEEPHQATERRLDMAARAAEPVVEVEMAEGGIEVVAPHQDHDPAAEPDAFGVAGRAVDRLLGLNEFVGLALVVLGGIRGRRIGGFLRLVLRAEIAALGKGATDTEQQCEGGDPKVTQ